MRWVGAILDAMNEIQRNLSRLTTPYLLVHGDGDQLVKIDGSRYMRIPQVTTRHDDGTRMSFFTDSTERTNSLSKGISDE